MKFSNLAAAAITAAALGAPVIVTSPALAGATSQVQDSQRFHAAGRVTGVDAAAGTLSLTTVQSGSPETKGRTLTIVVSADTKLVLDGAEVALADLPVGTQAGVGGMRSGHTWTAIRVHARTL